MDAGQPCAVHDERLEQLRQALAGLRDQLREGLGAVAAQSRANGRALARLADAQTTRRELCARQEARLGSVERGADLHRAAHVAERDEYLGERADIWAALNKLRFHVYVGIGAGLVLQTLIPLALRLAVK